jgi:biopolymer transport protein ExbD
MRGTNRRKKRVQSFNNVNLTPLLDFIVAVIPVLLLSVTFFDYVTLDASLPAFVSSEEQKAPESNTEKLGLTVAITDDGFVVGGQEILLKVGGGETTIKKTVKGDYDYSSLNNRIFEIKKHFSKEWTVIIVPQSDTKFETLVNTMDATREYLVVDSSGNMKKEILFPDVVVGGGIL